MVKAFSALGASVRFFHGQDTLFGEGVVRESLPRGNGAILLWLWRRRRRLLLLLFALQVDSLMPGKRGGVIESFAAVSAGVALPLGVDSLVPGQGRGMIEALIAVMTHVGLVPLLEHPLLRGSAVGQGLPGLGWRKHRVLQVGLVVAGERGGVIEALVAMSAGVGLPSGVDLLVLLQMAFADKTLSAHVAFVGLLARVDPLVLSQGGGGRETLATLGAPVGFVSEHNRGVRLLVLLQVGSRSEAFATLAAGVWLFARVDLLVLFKVPSADKAFPTLGALIGLVLRMHLHVFSQGYGGRKALTALRASVGLVWQMNHLMRLEAEGINNIFTHNLNSGGNIGLFFHVNLHMLLETRLHGKALATVDTDVRVEVLMDLKVLVKIGYAAENLAALVALQTVGFVDDDAVLRLHRQLPSVVRLDFHHVLAFRLEQHLSQQSLASRRLDFCPCETVHLTMFHFDVIMVCLGYNCIHTSYSTELCPQSLDL